MATKVRPITKVKSNHLIHEVDIIDSLHQLKIKKVYCLHFFVMVFIKALAL